MSCATLYPKQSTTACEQTATPVVCGKAEVADADQALRQNVDQESAQKLICGDRHDLLLATLRIVFPAKPDAIILERDLLGALLCSGSRASISLVFSNICWTVARSVLSPSRFLYMAAFG